MTDPPTGGGKGRGNRGQQNNNNNQQQSSRGNRNRGGKSRGGGDKGGGNRGQQGGRNSGNQSNNNSNNNNNNNNNKHGGNRNKDRRKGGGDNNNNKSSSPSTASILSQQEKKRLEVERREKEQAAQAEAERQRQQEAAKALETARLEQERQLCTNVRETIEKLSSLAQTVQRHVQQRDLHSPDPLLQARKTFEKQKRQLKSDLKKCTAFVKKIKAGSAWSMKPPDIQRDVASLNLSRYTEEVASAIVEAKLKLADLPTLLALCAAMHVRYHDFIPLLLPKLWAIIHNKHGSHSNNSAHSAPEEAKIRRLYVRLLTEFVLNGILTETKHLLKLIGEVTGGTAGTYAVTDANMVVSFCKAAGFQILAFPPFSVSQNITFLQNQLQRFNQNQQQKPTAIAPNKIGNNDQETNQQQDVFISCSLADESRNVISAIQAALQQRAVPPPIAKAFGSHCLGAFGTLSKTLVDTHGRLKKLEKRCQQDRLVQGSLSEAREKGLADARKLNESLSKSVEALAEVLNKPVPILDDGEEEGEADGGPGVELWTKEEGTNDSQNDLGPFDDDETRSFYCDVPDLLTTIPPALLGMTAEEIEKLQAENLVKYGTGGDATGQDQPQIIEEEQQESLGPLLGNEEEASGAGTEDDIVESTEEEGNENKDTPHYRLMVLLEQELPECNRREQVDEIAEKFCVNHGASKNSRKRLAKTLFLVPRTRLDLLPYYSRFAAIIDRIFRDVTSSLTTELEQQFHGLAKFKKNQNPEARLKNARYLGELTKFRVAPPIVALRCVRRCLDDFSGFNIDVACCVLESCGRYLYRMKHTASKLTQLMDAMMRFAKAKNLEERYHALINSAFFMVKPPPAAPKKMEKVYPPLEAYLRDLLMVRLQPEEACISFTTKQILKLPWNDPSERCGALVCAIMMKACRKGRYKAIAAVAAVVASIRRSKPEVAARVVDACLEEIQSALEHPSFQDQQRTLTYARLLGELHSATLVTGQVIIDQLYKFVNFGHEIPDALREASELMLAAEQQQQCNGGGKASEKLPVYHSAGGVSQAIQEDEELEDGKLETKEEPEMPKTVAVSKHSKYDPRVPSPIDPPNSVFRIKLVCTLLEGSAKSLVTRNNLSALEGFVASFQRYLFTKSVLPTEVEFSLLDTFDVLDSHWRRVTSKDKKSEEHGFTRCENWVDAHNAAVAKEEQVALSEQRNRTRLEALAGFGKPAELDLVEELGEEELEIIEDDESDESNSVVEDTESEAEDDFIEETESIPEDIDADDESSDDEDSEEETDDDLEDDNDFSDDEEMDEEFYMKQLEEEAFERELRRMTMDALEKGKNLARAAAGGKVADYMPSGSHFIRKKIVEPPISQTNITGSNDPVALGGQSGINFQVLKKGNKGKVEAKQLVVPKDTNLAKLATKQDDEAARERNVIKARVLQYEAESATQEASGGNVYLEQTKLQVIRNRPLSMEDIDRNFGTGNGDRRPAPETRKPTSSGRGGARGPFPRGGGSGRGGGRSRGGRTLRNF